MPDIPRDPRQLARDILAGKISIEELAREQQRRAAGGAQVPPAQARMPERIPLPRQAPPPPRTAQRPVIRQVPPPQQQRTIPPPPVIKAQPVRRQKPVVRAEQPVPISPQAKAAPAAPTAPLAPLAPTAPRTSAQAFATKELAVRDALSINKVMRNRAALRQCMVMSEVLAKPLALREDW